MVVYTKDQIESASNSPIYKPDYDDTDVALYNLMADNSQDIIDQYTRTFMSLPTANPYSGVIENPNKCDINDTNTSKSDLNTQINNLYNSTDVNGNKFSNDPTWQYNMNPDNKDGWYNQLFGDPFNGAGSPDVSNTSYSGDDIITGGSDATLTSSINLISDHTDRMVSNISSILGMVQAALGLASILGNLLNPCLGTSDFFKSLLDDGKKIISDIKSAIDKAVNYVKEAINVAMEAIDDVTTKIEGYIKDIIDYAKQGLDFIKKEVKKLVDSLIKSIKTSLSGFLKGLNLDPCSSFLMKKVTTGAASLALGSIV